MKSKSTEVKWRWWKQVLFKYCPSWSTGQLLMSRERPYLKDWSLSPCFFFSHQQYTCMHMYVCVCACTCVCVYVCVCVHMCVPVEKQRGVFQCSHCTRWFRSKGGLAVHRCRRSILPRCARSDLRELAPSVSRRATWPAVVVEKQGQGQGVWVFGCARLSYIVNGVLPHRGSQQVVPTYQLFFMLFQVSILRRLTSSPVYSL